MRVYLAGPINGCSDEEARGWREAAKQLRPDIEWVDPMARDYRGREVENAGAIVDGDCADIESCDKVLAWVARATWGTAMEIRAAVAEYRRPVIGWGAPANPSPWLTVHVDLKDTLHAAVMAL